MHIYKTLHSWQLSIQEAIIIQKKLATMIDLTPPAKPLRYIAGLDAGFLDEKTCIAAVVLWDKNEQTVFEQYTAIGPVYIPYIPGFLSFREAPTLLAVLEKLTRTPDVLMCDGHGIAHPRRLGIAAHLGVFTQMSALGCGKSRLVGEYQEPKSMRGEKSPLYYKQEIIGTVLRTKNNTKPVFVSPGHKMDLVTAEQLVLDCLKGYRLPEPTRLADKLVADTKKLIIQSR